MFMALAGRGSEDFCQSFNKEHPEMETYLKLLYTAMTRAQRRLNFIETSTSRAASLFLSTLQKKVHIHLVHCTCIACM